MISLIHSTFLFILAFLAVFAPQESVSYEPTWESLDSRPLPAWYDEAKFGIFIHWGVFSVPAYGGEWMWEHAGKYFHGKSKDIQEFINKTELPNFGYADYAHRFDATLYDPKHWAEVFANSGAQYVVLTSKHHEGYCLWDSRDVPTTWNWNAMEVGPRRDLVGELATEVKVAFSNFTNRNLRFGLYHSLYEWFNPLLEVDAKHNFTSNHFVQLKTMPELYDIVKRYEPEILWSDGDWVGPTENNSDWWQSKEFLAWYVTNSTVNETAVYNDRWGRDTNCKHGSFVNCQDHFMPGDLKEQKWENALPITKTSWGFDRKLTLESYHDTGYLIHSLIQTVALNGNMLLNVGPRADGTIDAIFEQRLADIGDWLNVNGEAIYGTRPWRVVQREESSRVFYTTKKYKDEGNLLYALFTEWPDDSKLQLAYPIATDQTKIRMLGVTGPKAFLNYTTSIGITVELPTLTPNQVPCQHAWVLLLSGIQNAGALEIMNHQSSKHNETEIEMSLLATKKKEMREAVK